MKAISNVVEYEKPKVVHPFGFSKHFRRKQISKMSEYILVHGIRIAKDFTPETFGRLTTIGPKFVIRANPKRTMSMQVCQCKCGERLSVLVNSLRCGNTTSCGCRHLQDLKSRATIHGLRHSLEYARWQSMKRRCFNKNDKEYKNYGGRGITVCERWREPNGQGFINFLADMGNCPPGLSIDRIDVNSNYCLGNCRWATAREQASNKRNTVFLEHRGQLRTLVAWSEMTGLKCSVLRYRQLRGWTSEDILTTPSGTKKKDQK